jgi:hypothetical protein
MCSLLGRDDVRQAHHEQGTAAGSKADAVDAPADRIGSESEQLLGAVVEQRDVALVETLLVVEDDADQKEKAAQS